MTVFGLNDAFVEPPQLKNSATLLLPLKISHSEHHYYCSPVRPWTFRLIPSRSQKRVEMMSANREREKPTAFYKDRFPVTYSVFGDMY